MLTSRLSYSFEYIKPPHPRGQGDLIFNLFLMNELSIQDEENPTSGQVVVNLVNFLPSLAVHFLLYLLGKPVKVVETYRFALVCEFWLDRHFLIFLFADAKVIGLGLVGMN